MGSNPGYLLKSFLLYWDSSISCNQMIWIFLHTVRSINDGSAVDPPNTHRKSTTSRFLCFFGKKFRSGVFPDLDWPYVGLEIQLIWSFCIGCCNIDWPQSNAYPRKSTTFFTSFFLARVRQDAQALQLLFFPVHFDLFS